MFGLAKCLANLFLIVLWMVKLEASPQRASNSGYGLFSPNTTKPVIFINNPDLLHVKHSHSFDEGLKLPNINLQHSHDLIGENIFYSFFCFCLLLYNILLQKVFP